MEKIIYNELIIRGYSVDVGIFVFDFKDENNKSQRKQYEVNFICNNGNNRYYIQSVFSLNNIEKMNKK